MRVPRPVRLVMVFGSFDLLHPGHVWFVENAKKRGGELIAVVARDSSIERPKGRKPLFSEGERLHLVGALRAVDKAVLGGSKDFHAVVRRWKPQVVVLGYDQSADVNALKKTGAQVVRLRAFKPRRHKSSLLKKRLRKNG